jgi:hypothetical protein
MLFGTLMHRNLISEFPPEYHSMPNGDNLFPALFAPFGSAKFQSDVGPLAYRQHTGGQFSSMPNLDRFGRDLRTRLMMTEYSIRNNPPELTARVLNDFLFPMMKAWMQGYEEICRKSNPQ